MKNKILLIFSICLIASIVLGSCVTTGNGNEITISFDGNKATVKGVGASSQGADVRIGAAGSYVLTGSTSNGSVTIDAHKAEIELILDDVFIQNPNGPAIFIKDAKKVTFILPQGSESTLIDGDFYEIKDINAFVDGAIFAKADLVFRGEGTLTVQGNNAHGIVAKDGILIDGANINVTSKKVGISGKDFIEVINSNINISSGTDGLRSDNITESGKGYVTIDGGNYNISSGGDAIQAYSVVKIVSGSFNLTTTLVDPLLSTKGIKGTNKVEILGGTFNIDSIDDAIHSDVDVYISGGDFSISTGDDGIHANNELHITGGCLTVNKSYEGFEASSIIIDGGIIKINSTDDGINSAGGNDQSSGDDIFSGVNGGISINGGYIVVKSNSDGVDCFGSFDMSGGTLLVEAPSSEKKGALDFASDASITGGVVVAVGIKSEPQSFTSATQGVVLVNNADSAGTVISIIDDKGNVVLAFKSTVAFDGFLISAPELEQGKTYSIYKNSNVSGFDENGFVRNTTQSGGEELYRVIFDTLIK